MVDSRKGGAMADDLTVRVQALEERVEALSISMHQRFDGVDAEFRRVHAAFDAVDAAFLEQRQYTEFAYERLDTKMDAGFARLDEKIALLDEKVDAGFARTDGHLGRLERKLDPVLDGMKPSAPDRQ
jgi:hypothetical protein